MRGFYVIARAVWVAGIILEREEKTPEPDYRAAIYQSG
jgi:hypothetical protein